MTTLETVEMHTAGEPVRIVVSGFPTLSGDTILEKRRDVRARFDHLRRALMHEPRGHADMYGVIPVEPTHPEAVFAALFIHHEGYSTMCGHATIALGRWLVESGRVAAVEPLTRFSIELPCGLVSLACRVEGGRVRATRFESVPAFLALEDAVVEAAGLGPVTLDVAYGGAFYAVLPASRLGLDLFGTPLETLRRAAMAITEAGRASLAIRHPAAPDLGFLYGTILTDDSPPPRPTSNLCVFADGQIDRSPTGSGATARMACDHARGLIGANVPRAFHGATGLPFTAEIVGARGGEGVVVSVSGASAFTGTARFTIEDDDPLGHGFVLPGTMHEIAS
jgi:proline racemase